MFDHTTSDLAASWMRSSCAVAPASRVSSIVAASVFVHPVVIAALTAPGLNAANAAHTTLINDNDIVAVDRSATNPGELSGKIVVTWQRESGLTLSRFLLVNGVQLLESENRDYEAVKLGKNRSWRIMGKVLWWIRQAP